MNTISCSILSGMIGPFQWLIFGPFLLLALLLTIFYLNTLQKTFDEISEVNRRMSSGLVWLSLIPLFGTVWQFIIVNKMADSLRAEFDKRQISYEEKRPGYITGLLYSIFFAISALGNIIGTIIHLQHWPDWQQSRYLKIIGSVVGIIFWIIYWIKINGYKSRLQQNRIE
jgi:hypothetical protein